MSAARVERQESWEVRQRRLRNRLRIIRERQQLTQKQVSEDTEWSPSKIIRIEQGLVTISPRDLDKLLRVYKVDRDERESLIDLQQPRPADRSFKPWEDSKERFAKAERDLYNMEQVASTIYKYEPSFVPGFMQLPEYTEALLRRLGLSSDDVLAKLQTRTVRNQVIDQSDRPELRFLLGEAVLCRPVGGVHTMLQQIEYLKELATREGIYLQILPFSAGPHRAMGEDFTVLTFDQGADDQGDLPNVLFLQDADRESTERTNPKALRRYLDIFNELSDLASPAEQFADAADTITRRQFGKTTADLKTLEPERE